MARGRIRWLADLALAVGVGLAMGLTHPCAAYSDSEDNCECHGVPKRHHVTEGEYIVVAPTVTVHNTGKNHSKDHGINLNDEDCLGPHCIHTNVEFEIKAWDDDLDVCKPEGKQTVSAEIFYWPVVVGISADGYWAGVLLWFSSYEGYVRWYSPMSWEVPDHLAGKVVKMKPYGYVIDMYEYVWSCGTNGRMSSNPAGTSEILPQTVAGPLCWPGIPSPHQHCGECWPTCG
jgi:hypothetical protein